MPDETNDILHLVSRVAVVSHPGQPAREGVAAHGVDVEGYESPHHEDCPEDAGDPGDDTAAVQAPVVEEGRLVETEVGVVRRPEGVGQDLEILGVELSLIHI